MSAADYLAKPYQRCVVPEADGTFRAEIVEFPGCMATGDTGAEALASLEAVAESWLEATLEKGLRVPEPMENSGFSGKLMLRLPKSLHRKAAHASARDGVSLNQFITASVAEAVGERSAFRHTSIKNNTVVFQYLPTGSRSFVASAGIIGGPRLMPLQNSDTSVGINLMPIDLTGQIPAEEL